NEIGTIQPIRLLAELAHNAGTYFHCDAAQALGSGADILEIIEHCDAASFSGHKFYAPKGIGLMILKESWQNNFRPLMFGGHQQNGIRPGTIPTSHVCAIAEAMQLSFANIEEESVRIRNLRDYFHQQAIANGWPITLNGPKSANRHAGNINLCFDGIDNQELLGMLQPKVAASTGSACNSGMPAPSHVLTAIGLSREQANSSIRFSFGRFSTREQIDQIVTAVTEALEKII
ncbi:MAG: aminotransferase class V-fold PLP-dependent enzyme, partial [Candidatus Riflebacteria bacterium]|nr:aminotransferase class V-fold PLP-dependent enzyme [Candidatus Riflebacteria bacterium]